MSIDGNLYVQNFLCLFRLLPPVLHMCLSVFCIHLCTGLIAVDSERENMFRIRFTCLYSDSCHQDSKRPCHALSFSASVSMSQKRVCKIRALRKVKVHWGRMLVKKIYSMWERRKKVESVFYLGKWIWIGYFYSENEFKTVF